MVIGKTVYCCSVACACKSSTLPCCMSNYCTATTAFIENYWTKVSSKKLIMCCLVHLFGWPQKGGGQRTHGEKSWVFQAVVRYCNQEGDIWGFSIRETWRTGDSRGTVALLEAEGQCLRGPSCRPVCSAGSLLCLQDPLLGGCGMKICAWAILCLHTRRGLFSGICAWK